ncbi:redox-sensing transcriptional repressor Rex [Nakamurella silvestris]|nr:redox-sensing transcriptional repressor Rex [Nakamurella silvestris]
MDPDRAAGRLRAIPEATVARLAAYLRALAALSSSETASSEELAAAAGVNSATLRKDLSYLGSYGVRGVGYDVEVLTEEIGRVLGAHRRQRVALVGVGNLGAALAGYPGFLSRGLAIGALLDVHPDRVGTAIAGLTIEHFDELAPVCRREDISIGVIATPEGAAQKVADALVAAGVRSILTFSPGVISVPPGVDLRRVDLALELQILAFHQTRRADLVPEVPAGEVPAEEPTLDGVSDDGETREATQDDPGQDGTNQNGLIEAGPTADAVVAGLDGR